MFTTANFPKFFWAIVSVPLAFLIISLAWFIFTYANLMKYAKESTLVTPIGSITTKVNALENHIQNTLSYNQLLTSNNQFINQLEMPKSSAHNDNIEPIEIPAIINNLKNQFTLLQDQKQRLEEITSELRNIKQQMESMEIAQSRGLIRGQA